MEEMEIVKVYIVRTPPVNRAIGMPQEWWGEMDISVGDKINFYRDGEKLILEVKKCETKLKK